MNLNDVLGTNNIRKTFLKHSQEKEELLNELFNTILNEKLILKIGSPISKIVSDIKKLIMKYERIPEGSEFDDMMRALISAGERIGTKSEKKGAKILQNLYDFYGPFEEETIDLGKITQKFIDLIKKYQSEGGFFSVALAFFNEVKNNSNLNYEAREITSKIIEKWSILIQKGVQKQAV